MNVCKVRVALKLDRMSGISEAVPVAEMLECTSEDQWSRRNGILKQHKAGKQTR
jgi:hypothetical protein